MSEIAEREESSSDRSEQYDQVDQNISSTEKKSKMNNAYGSPGKTSNLSMGDIHASPSKDGTQIPFTEFKIKTNRLDVLQDSPNLDGLNGK